METATEIGRKGENCRIREGRVGIKRRQAGDREIQENVSVYLDLHIFQNGEAISSWFLVVLIVFGFLVGR